VYSWVTGVLNATLVAMVLPVLYLTLGVADAATVFSPWATTVPWLCLGGLILGQMMEKSGLATRLAYKCMLLAGDSFMKTLLALMLTGYIIAPLIPTVLGKATIFFTLGAGMCNVLKLSPDSKESAAIFMTCAVAVACPAYGFLTGCAQIPAAILLLESVTQLKITWFDYAYHNFVPSLVYSAVSFTAMLLILRPQNLEGIRKVVAEKYQALGPMSLVEKKAACLLILTLLLLITETQHGVNAAWCIMLAAAVPFLPGMNLLESSDLEKISFSLLYFVAGAMSVGAVAAKIGVAVKIAAAASVFLAAGHAIVHMVSSFFLGIVTVIFLSPTAGMTSLCVPLANLALEMSLDPRAFLYPFFYGIDMFFMPYQYGLALLLVSYKRISLKYMTQVLLLKILLSSLILLPFSIFYWHLIGLW
jgi:di/tricarboxylate transporter